MGRISGPSCTESPASCMSTCSPSCRLSALALSPIAARVREHDAVRRCPRPPVSQTAVRAGRLARPTLTEMTETTAKVTRCASIKRDGPALKGPSLLVRKVRLTVLALP